ncbi:MAG: WG repeat-containing protein [Aureispira sp.]|nr:WG repeat-containing protein [Aureispira sp.]
MQLKSIHIIILCLFYFALNAQQVHQNSRMKRIIDFDQQHYFAQNKKGRWGMCLANGRPVVPMNYDTLLALDIVNFNPKDYSMEHIRTNYLIGKKGADQVLLNLKGEILLTVNSIMPRMMGDVILVRKGAAWGLAKTTGEFLLPTVCTEIEWYDDILALKYEGKWKLFHPKQKKSKLEESYDSVEEVINNTRYNQKESFLLVQENKKWGLLDKNLKTVIPIEKDALKPLLAIDKYSKKKTQFLVKEAGKWGVLDINNQLVLNLEYADIQPVQWKRNTLNIPEQPLFVVTKNGKKGIVDAAGNIVLPIEYDAINYNKAAFDGLFEVEEGTVSKQIQWNGTTMVELSMKP